MAGYPHARCRDLGCPGRGPRRRARPGARAGARPPRSRCPLELDNAAFYEAQTICDPTPRPGATALQNLLLATYGPATIYIPRTCTSSTSEHFDGRAVDWMRSVARAGREGDGRRVRGLAARPGRRRHAARDGPAPGDHVHHLGQPDDPDVRPRSWLDRVPRLPGPGQLRHEPGHHLPPQPRAHVDVLGRRRRDHQLVDRRGPDPAVLPDDVVAGHAGDRVPGWSCPTSAPSRERSRSPRPPSSTPGPGVGAGLTGSCRSLAGRSLYPTAAVAGLVPAGVGAVVLQVTSSSNAPATLAAWSSGSPAASRPGRRPPSARRPPRWSSRWPRTGRWRWARRWGRRTSRPPSSVTHRAAAPSPSPHPAPAPPPAPIARPSKPRSVAVKSVASRGDDPLEGAEPVGRCGR